MAEAIVVSVFSALMAKELSSIFSHEIAMLAL